MFYSYVTRSGSGIRMSQWNKWINDPADPHTKCVKIESDKLLTWMADLFLTETERQKIGNEKYKYTMPTGWVRRPSDGYSKSDFS